QGSQSLTLGLTLIAAPQLSYSRKRPLPGPEISTIAAAVDQSSPNLLPSHRRLRLSCREWSWLRRAGGRAPEASRPELDKSQPVVRPGPGPDRPAYAVNVGDERSTIPIPVVRRGRHRTECR